MLNLHFRPSSLVALFCLVSSLFIQTGPIPKAYAPVDLLSSDIRTDHKRNGAGPFYTGVWHQTVAKDGIEFEAMSAPLINDTSRSAVYYTIVWLSFEPENATTGDPIRVDNWVGFEWEKNLLISNSGDYANLTRIIEYHLGQNPKPTLVFRFDVTPKWAKPNCVSSLIKYYPIVNPYPDYFFAIRMFLKHVVFNMSYPAGNVIFSPVNEPKLFYSGCDTRWDSAEERISNAREILRQAWFAAKNVSSDIRIMWADENIQDTGIVRGIEDYLYRVLNFAPWKYYVEIVSVHNYPQSWSENGDVPGVLRAKLDNIWRWNNNNASHIRDVWLTEWADNGATGNGNAITQQWNSRDDAHLAFKRMRYYTYYDKLNATFITRMHNSSLPPGCVGSTCLATAGRGIAQWRLPTTIHKFETYHFVHLLNWYGGQGWVNVNATDSTTPPNKFYAFAFINEPKKTISVFALRNSTGPLTVDFRVWTNGTNFTVDKVNIWNLTNGARLVHAGSIGEFPDGASYVYTINSRNMVLIEFYQSGGAQGLPPPQQQLPRAPVGPPPAPPALIPAPQPQQSERGPPAVPPPVLRPEVPRSPPLPSAEDKTREAGQSFDPIMIYSAGIASGVLIMGMLLLFYRRRKGR